VDVTVQTYKAFLDDAWDAAPAAANTLREQLRAFEKQVTTLFSAGALGSVSKNTASQSYRGPGVGSYTPAQLQTVWRDLIDLFDEVKAWVDAEISESPPDPNPPPNDGDPVIYDHMKRRLMVITEYSPNLIDLRLQPTLRPRPLVSW
jgi:hypothetical protein